MAGGSGEWGVTGPHRGGGARFAPEDWPGRAARHDGRARLLGVGVPGVQQLVG